MTCAGIAAPTQRSSGLSFLLPLSSLSVVIFKFLLPLGPTGWALVLGRTHNVELGWSLHFIDGSYPEPEGSYDRGMRVRRLLEGNLKLVRPWDIKFQVVILILDAAVLGLIILNVGSDPKNWILVCIWGLIVLIQLLWLVRMLAKSIRLKQQARLDGTSTLNQQL